MVIWKTASKYYIYPESGKKSKSKPGKVSVEITARATGQRLKSSCDLKGQAQFTGRDAITWTDLI